METTQVAARFAAFVWYLNEEKTRPAEAGRLARQNWQSFLPVADDKLCRLVSKPRRSRRLAAWGR